MSKARVLLFSLVLSTICAGLLGGARTLTKDEIARNERLDEWRAILDAADYKPQGVGSIAEMKAKDVETIYGKRVKLADGADPVRGPFSYKGSSGKVEAQILRIRGKGLWGEMFGFLAVAPKPTAQGKLKLQGITFYKEEETPGLGKRINEMKFKGQFREDQGRLAPGLRILKGEGNETGPMKVDGITSATVTSVGVQKMIEDGATWYLGWRKSGGGK